MKKLLLAAALLTSVASAQFIEKVIVDPMTDEKTYSSAVRGTMDYDGRPATGLFILTCQNGKELGIIITSDSIYNMRVKKGTLEMRTVPDRNYRFDYETGEKMVILFNGRDDSIEQLSNSELRVRFRDEINYTSYLTFELPDLMQAEAYKACKGK